MIVRPVPDEFQADELAKGKTHIRWGISASWFSKGGIQWDDGQLSVLDADGAPHAVPIPPNGALVRHTTVVVEQGRSSEAPELFVADETKHRVVQLPDDGFAHVGGLDALAAVAGLHYAETRTTSPGDHPPEGGYPSTKETLNLRKCVKSMDDHHGIGGLLRRRDSST
jgi:hypothetical protein